MGRAYSMVDAMENFASGLDMHRTRRAMPVRKSAACVCPIVAWYLEPTIAAYWGSGNVKR